MEEKEIQIIDEQTFKSKIYFIRNQKVMMDADLAEIYGYTTKDFNRQVKNNKEKFDDDFMFQLSNEETQNLRCKNSTSSWGGSRYNPFAFTEQGILTFLFFLFHVFFIFFIYFCFFYLHFDINVFNIIILFTSISPFVFDSRFL